MATKSSKMSLNGYLQLFKANMGSAEESIRLAAKAYADAVLHYPTRAQTVFHNAYPHVSDLFWDKLRLIGNGDVHPCVLLFSDKMSWKIARMPMREQKRILDGRKTFEVVDRQTGNVERVSFTALKPRHESVLFDDKRNKFRTVEEQREFILNETKDRKTGGVPYVINGDTCVILRKCVLGVSEVEHILKIMKGSAQ